MSLYRAYFVHGGVDPSGLDEVRILTLTFEEMRNLGVPEFVINDLTEANGWEYDPYGVQNKFSFGGHDLLMRFGDPVRDINGNELFKVDQIKDTTTGVLVYGIPRLVKGSDGKWHKVGERYFDSWQELIDDYSKQIGMLASGIHVAGAAAFGSMFELGGDPIPALPPRRILGGAPKTVGRSFDDILSNDEIFKRWLKHNHPNNQPLSPDEAARVWDKLRQMGKKPRLDQGHPGTKWDMPHINVDGTHIPCDPGFTPE